MKDRFVADILDQSINDVENFSGRVTGLRDHGDIIFLDISDYTDEIQVVLERDEFSGNFEKLKELNEGAYVQTDGELDEQGGQPEIKAENLEVLKDANLHLSPKPWRVNGLEHRHGKQVFDHPGMYVSNPERSAVLEIKNNLLNSLHDYFQENDFTRVEPPILTDKTLYEHDNAVEVDVHDESVFLSQCATFELEPMALAHGKVYTISPAFRNEPSGSKRHLAEYTHAKAEALEADHRDLMELASDSLFYALKETSEQSQEQLDLIGEEIDFEGIRRENQVEMTYDEAVEILQGKGIDIEYGDSLSDSHEEELTSHVGDRYLWVKFLPFDTEGFPYRRKDGEEHLSMTCDLIAPHGAGEMVGVAEKVDTAEELVENIIDKGKKEDIKNYWDYISMRRYGLPEHGGIGAAPERILYGVLDLDHIKLTKPWPRYPDRKIDPEKRELPTWGDYELERLIDEYNLEEEL